MGLAVVAILRPQMMQVVAEEDKRISRVGRGEREVSVVEEI
jgi:hypothetical protein